MGQEKCYVNGGLRKCYGRRVITSIKKINQSLDHIYVFIKYLCIRLKL